MQPPCLQRARRGLRLYRRKANSVLSEMLADALGMVSRSGSPAKDGHPEVRPAREGGHHDGRRRLERLDGTRWKEIGNPAGSVLLPAGFYEEGRCQTITK